MTELLVNTKILANRASAGSLIYRHKSTGTVFGVTENFRLTLPPDCVLADQEELKVLAEVYIQTAYKVWCACSEDFTPLLAILQYSQTQPPPVMVLSPSLFIALDSSLRLRN